MNRRDIYEVAAPNLHHRQFATGDPTLHSLFAHADCPSKLTTIHQWGVAGRHRHLLFTKRISCAHNLNPQEWLFGEVYRFK